MQNIHNSIIYYIVEVNFEIMCSVVSLQHSRSLFQLCIYIYIYIAWECATKRIDVDVLFDRRSTPGSNQTIVVVGFPKLYPAIPMQFGSNVMTVSPPQSSQLGRHIWGEQERVVREEKERRETNTRVFIRVGFRMVYTHRRPGSPRMRDGYALYALSREPRLSYCRLAY